MNLRNMLLLRAAGIFFTVCFARSSRSLQTHNLMEKFFSNIGKAEVNTFGKITIFGDTNYWWNINFEKIDDKRSSVIIYSYLNTNNTRDRVNTIKDWLLNNSKKCDKYIF